MGIFGKLFGALKKTKDGLAAKMRMLFSKNKLGNEFYEELEEILISADVSVSTAEKVVDGVKESTGIDLAALIAGVGGGKIAAARAKNKTKVSDADAVADEAAIADASDKK